MTTGEKERILEKMVAHGFPLEIEVSSLMSKRGWTVINQAFYKDEETGKMRTVDIWAILSHHPKIGRHDLVHFSLITECKKSVKPWVFYTKEKDWGKKLAMKYWSKSMRAEWLVHTHHYREDSKEVAVIPFEPFQGEDKSDILEASMQVIKALNFRKDYMVQLHNRSRIKKNPLYILYPAIVFDGNLWKCELKEGNPEISKAQYFEYAVDYDGIVLIDIVQKAYLSKFLETLEMEFKEISGMIEKLA